MQQLVIGVTVKLLLYEPSKLIKRSHVVIMRKSCSLARNPIVTDFQTQLPESEQSAEGIKHVRQADQQTDGN